MKKIILLILTVLTLTAASHPQSFHFVRYSDGVRVDNTQGEIIGVVMTKGVRAIRGTDGSIQYYIAGDYLKQVIEAYNKE